MDSRLQVKLVHYLVFSHFGGSLIMQTREKILKVAEAFDDVIETRDIEKILPFFAEDCEIEVLGITLQGREGARVWLKWMFKHLALIKFKPVIIMVEGDTIFEEFMVNGVLHNGRKVSSKQAEVLVYENYLVKKLRLYFDRLDFADAVSKGFFDKFIIRQIKKKSLQDLV